MDNSKSAVLFQNFEKLPVAFQKYKTYQLGTGYVALFDNENNKPMCMLCRILDDKEISSFDKKAINTLVLKHSECIQELTILIISSNLKSIEEADNIINNYKKTPIIQDKKED